MVRGLIGYNVLRLGEGFNLKTSRQLKRSYRGKNKGYFIGEFFYSLEDLRPFLKRDANKKADYPF